MQIEELLQDKREEILKIALLGRKVDVVTAKSLHYFIRECVLKEAIPL
jgi:predicted nucleotidyltransferase